MSADELICEAHWERRRERVPAFKVGLCRDCFTGKMLRAGSEAETEPAPEITDEAFQRAYYLAGKNGKKRRREKTTGGGDRGRDAQRGRHDWRLRRLAELAGLKLNARELGQRLGVSRSRLLELIAELNRDPRL